MDAAKAFQSTPGHDVGGATRSPQAYDTQLTTRRNQPRSSESRFLYCEVKS
jgi:hypothetical protein